jgi:hypothetical protein
MNLSLKVLKVIHFGDTPEENRAITFSPGSIRLVAAEQGITIKQDRPLRSATVLFNEGDNVEVVISDYDLEVLERVIGGYDFEPVS